MTHFRKSYDFESRCNESQRIRDKYEDRVPIIVHRSPHRRRRRAKQTTRQGGLSTGSDMTHHTHCPNPKSARLALSRDLEFCSVYHRSPLDICEISMSQARMPSPS